MSEQASKLEPFLLLARSTKGAAAAKVIVDATAAPGTYVFGELLELPSIRELKDDEVNGKAYALLELFAYGTLKTYNQSKDSFSALSPAHLTKLRHLTLVSVALSKRSIPYDTLLTSLGAGSIRELEDLIIDVIYAGLLKGKMHHHEKVLHVDWVTGRDVAPSDLPILQQSLRNWSTTAHSLLIALDEEIDRVRKETMNRNNDHAAYIAQRDASYAHVMETHSKAQEKTRRGVGGFNNAANSLPGWDPSSGKSWLGKGASNGGGPLPGARNSGTPDVQVATRGAKRPRE